MNSPERPDSDHTEGDRITAQFQEWGIPLRGHAVAWSVAGHNPDWFEANPKIEDFHFRIDDIIGRNKGSGSRFPAQSMDHYGPNGRPGSLNL